jgi:hypothetical protein
MIVRWRGKGESRRFIEFTRGARKERRREPRKQGSKEVMEVKKQKKRNK